MSSISERGQFNGAEYSIEVRGCTYDCIIGHRTRGAFLAVPNWLLSADLENRNIRYNKANICEAIKGSKHMTEFCGFKENEIDLISQDLAEIVTDLLKNIPLPETDYEET